MQRLMENRELLRDLRVRFRASRLADNVDCLIVHGSCLYYPLYHRVFSDVDLELVLKESRPGDYQLLKTLLDTIPVKTECQLRYRKEVVELDLLTRLRGYRLFLCYAYSNGVCLIGKNIYQQIISSLPDSLVRQSILSSVQVAFKSIRQAYLRGADAYTVNKHIVQTFQDICLYDSLLGYQDLGTKKMFLAEEKAFVPEILRRYGKALTRSDRALLGAFTGYYTKGVLHAEVFPVVERVVYAFLSLSG